MRPSICWLPSSCRQGTLPLCYGWPGFLPLFLHHHQLGIFASQLVGGSSEVGSLLRRARENGSARTRAGAREIAGNRGRGSERELVAHRHRPDRAPEHRAIIVAGVLFALFGSVLLAQSCAMIHPPRPPPPPPPRVPPPAGSGIRQGSRFLERRSRPLHELMEILGEKDPDHTHQESPGTLG